MKKTVALMIVVMLAVASIAQAVIVETIDVANEGVTFTDVDQATLAAQWFNVPTGQACTNAAIRVTVGTGSVAYGTHTVVVRLKDQDAVWHNVNVLASALGAPTWVHITGLSLPPGDYNIQALTQSASLDPFLQVFTETTPTVPDFYPGGHAATGWSGENPVGANIDYQAEFTMVPMPSLAVSESGGSTDSIEAVDASSPDDSFTVVLDTLPTADVDVAIATNSSDFLWVSTNMLTFTTSNWDTPQTVQVQALQDGTPDPQRDATITLDPQSTDTNYNALADSLVVVHITDSLAWVVDWTETGFGSAGNVYYSGGVFGGQFYTGQINYGPMKWDPTQTGGTALANSYTTAADNIDAAKSSTLLGGKVYYTGDDSGFAFYSVNDDWATGFATNTTPGVGCECITTDGTYLYVNDKNTGDIYKYDAAGALQTNYSTTAASIRGVSHYGGKLYVADNNGTGVYEVDISTGVSTQIATSPGTGAYQVSRFGNKMLVARGVFLDGYSYDGSSWGAPTSQDLGLGDLYGLAFDGLYNVWVTSLGYKVSYLSAPKPDPVIGDIAIVESAGGFDLTWATEEYYTYALLEKTNLVYQETWSTNLSGIPGTASNATVTVPASQAAAFYKVAVEE